MTCRGNLQFSFNFRIFVSNFKFNIMNITEQNNTNTNIKVGQEFNYKIKSDWDIKPGDKFAYKYTNHYGQKFEEVVTIYDINKGLIFLSGADFSTAVNLFQFKERIKFKI